MFVELADTQAWLALTVMGQAGAEREMLTAELLVALGPTPGFDDLTAVLNP